MSYAYDEMHGKVRPQTPPTALLRAPQQLVVVHHARCAAVRTVRLPHSQRKHGVGKSCKSRVRVALIRLLSRVACRLGADFFQQHRDKEAQLLSAELLALAKVGSMDVLAPYSLCLCL